jgi:tRNA (cytidine/uridine-2'-O-)-methyltransferase
MRLSANVGARLHLIEPLGFALDDKRLRRAGMDYRERATVTRHASLEAFRSKVGSDRWLALTTRAQRHYSNWAFQPGDVLLFGSETQGLPPALLDELPDERKLLIPQLPESRSLNLSNAVAVVVYEAWRQQHFKGAATSSPRRL